MSFGSLKTLKLERTLGDVVLSITKQVPTDADESIEFGELDLSIVTSARNLRDFAPSSNVIVTNKAEEVQAIPEVIKEVKKPNKRGAGRPKGTTKTKKVEEAKPTTKPELKSVASKIETVVDQDEKVALVQKFQATFESEIGFTNEDTYMDEFNAFLTSLISMDYKVFLDSDITESQLKTFADLI